MFLFKHAEKMSFCVLSVVKEQIFCVCVCSNVCVCGVDSRDELQCDRNSRL